MRIDVLTLFPEMFDSLNYSILKRAQEEGIISINVVNIRDFASAPHFKCDDEPYGGGAGMVMLCEPLFKAIESVIDDKAKVYYMSPRGKVFKQAIAKDMSTLEHIILICGHYEGIDQRIIDLCVDEQISIGDYVLTGGEIPAMVLVDAVARYIPNVLGSDTSAEDESFTDGYLEYPQYTRPREFMGLTVPETLLSGNHKEIEKWKQEKKIEETKKFRPDLLQK